MNMVQENIVQELEWDSNSLSQYVRICNESYAGNHYTIGNIDTGHTVHRKNFNCYNEEVGNEWLEISRFVNSFSYDEAERLLEKFKTEDPGLKIYHNFSWYANRLEKIRRIEGQDN